MTIEKREDGSYWLTGGRFGSVESGRTTVMADDGNTCLPTLTDYGSWEAVPLEP